jgi:hypothetical protein
VRLAAPFSLFGNECLYRNKIRGLSGGDSSSLVKKLGYVGAAGRTLQGYHSSNMNSQL